MTVSELMKEIENPDKWTSEFFEANNDLILRYWKTIRGTLSPLGLYAKFDNTRSEFMNPGQMKIINGIKESQSDTCVSGTAVLDNGKFRPAKNTNLEMISMDTVSEEAPEWLVLGYIPKYQITVLAGDGGSGKTSIWCAIAAAVSSGGKSFFEDHLILPDEFGESDPKKVLFFSSEDSFEYTLKGRLVKNGADTSNILSISLKDDRFSDIKFNSTLLESLIAAHRPELVIFDPIQSFIPPDTQMGQRNAMRACLNPLIGMGEKYKTTFLIVVHANKQSGVYSRKRIADSSDIWDIARSVLMVGMTNEKGIRYISQEKSNYGQLEDTILFTTEGGRINVEGQTEKRDREYVLEGYVETRQAPAKEEAKEFILDYLKDGEKEIADLDSMAKAMSISSNSLKNAKAELKKEGRVKNGSKGYGKDKKYYISLIPS